MADRIVVRCPKCDAETVDLLGYDLNELAHFKCGNCNYIFDAKDADFVQVDA